MKQACKYKKSNPVGSYKDLIVWQKAMVLAEKVYALSSSFPDTERFGLQSQLRRAAVSVPSNIAEGRSRNGKREFVQFLYIAIGSLNEIETQLELTRRLSLCSENMCTENTEMLIEVRKMLYALVAKVDSRPLTPERSPLTTSL